MSAVLWQAPEGLSWGGLHPSPSPSPVPGLVSWREEPEPEEKLQEMRTRPVRFTPVSTALQQCLAHERCSVSSTDWMNEWLLELLSRAHFLISCYLGEKKKRVFDTFELAPLNHTPCGVKVKKEKQSTQGMLSFLGTLGQKTWFSSKRPNTILSFVSPIFRLKTSLTLCYWNGTPHFPHE